MVDAGGGFLTAFKAAMSVGKKDGGGGEEPLDSDIGEQPHGSQGYPGAVEDHPGWDHTTGCCSAHPQGCADSANGGGHPWLGGEGFGGGVQGGSQGGAWSHPGTRGGAEGVPPRASGLNAWGQ